MRMAATLVLTVMLALPNAGPASAADPVPPIDLDQPTPAVRAADSHQADDPAPVRHPAAKRLDPSACAELCRFFERMWLLEKRAPEVPVPTS